MKYNTMIVTLAAGNQLRGQRDGQIFHMRSMSYRYWYTTIKRVGRIRTKKFWTTSWCNKLQKH